MNELVKVVEGHARADSRTVAALFDKRHDSVLRSIDGLLEQQPDLLHNFVEMVDVVDIGSSAQREARGFEMDRKGFALLAMGFTGAKALEWKVRFIDAFDAMERALASGLAPGGGIMGTPEAIEQLKLSLALVREMRATFGPNAARKVWAQLGLPTPLTELPRRNYVPPPLSIVDWRSGRVVPTGETERIKVSDLYEDYCKWCETNHRLATNMTVFGRALNEMGFDKIRSNNVWVTGFRLAA